jgi:hypothetical protein
MIGLTIGGILWESWEIRGECVVWFVLHSLATIANGFVQNVDQYLFAIHCRTRTCGRTETNIALTTEMLPRKENWIGHHCYQWVMEPCLYYLFVEW